MINESGSDNDVDDGMMSGHSPTDKKNANAISFATSKHLGSPAQVKSDPSSFAGGARQHSTSLHEQIGNFSFF